MFTLRLGNVPCILIGLQNHAVQMRQGFHASICSLVMILQCFALPEWCLRPEKMVENALWIFCTIAGIWRFWEPCSKYFFLLLTVYSLLSSVEQWIINISPLCVYFHIHQQVIPPTNCSNGYPFVQSGLFDFFCNAIITETQNPVCINGFLFLCWICLFSLVPCPTKSSDIQPALRQLPSPVITCRSLLSPAIILNQWLKCDMLSYRDYAVFGFHGSLLAHWVHYIITQKESWPRLLPYHVTSTSLTSLMHWEKMAPSQTSNNKLLTHTHARGDIRAASLEP